MISLRIAMLVDEIAREADAVEPAPKATRIAPDSLVAESA